LCERLYALEVPPSGGDTGLPTCTSLMSACRPKPAAAGRGPPCRHDSSRNSAGELRRGMTEVTDPREAPGRATGSLHPSGDRPQGIAGRRRNAYVEGLTLEESEQLLDELWRHATHPELPGISNGASATSSCGTIAARRIAATSSIQSAGRCTAPRSRAIVHFDGRG
jgi:hypothetical protein